MTTTFGRRAPAPRSAPAASAPVAAAVDDPRLRELAEAARAVRGRSPTRDAFRAYRGRRDRAIAPYRIARLALMLAVAVATLVPHVGAPVRVLLDLVSFAGMGLVALGRRRWAGRVEAEARAPQPSTSSE